MSQEFRSKLYRRILWRWNLCHYNPVDKLLWRGCWARKVFKLHGHIRNARINSQTQDLVCLSRYQFWSWKFSEPSGELSLCNGTGWFILRQRHRDYHLSRLERGHLEWRLPGKFKYELGRLPSVLSDKIFAEWEIPKERQHYGNLQI